MYDCKTDGRTGGRTDGRGGVGWGLRFSAFQLMSARPRESEWGNEATEEEEEEGGSQPGKPHLLLHIGITLPAVILILRSCASQSVQVMQRV